MSLRFIHSLCGIGFLSVLALLLVHGTDAFTAISSARAMREGTSLFVSLSTSVALKEELLALTSELAENGVFVYEQSSKERLEKAVSELEAVSTPPTQDDFLSLFRGDWKLLCTTGTNSKNKSLARAMKPPASFGIPFLSEDPLESIRRSVRERVEVRQRIRSMSEDGEIIDRVDNVVEVMPADTLSSIVSGLPDALASLSINPLGVDTAKVTLIHKANVDTTGSIPTTKLGLQSVVLTVAGTSQVLEPEGADVLGVNVPLGDFLNNGSFETTYIDDDLRISRGKLGLVNQLRVFRRQTTDSSNETPVADDEPVTPMDEEPVDLVAEDTTEDDVKTAASADETVETDDDPEDATEEEATDDE